MVLVRQESRLLLSDVCASRECADSILPPFSLSPRLSTCVQLIHKNMRRNSFLRSGSRPSCSPND